MKIAFLFLIVDDINFPKLWEQYFNNNYNKISIYCHPKNPDNVKTMWLKKNIINDLKPTKWGFFTDAIISLLKAALNDPDNTKFIIVSESCLPIKSFTNFYNMVTNDHINTSYIKLYDFSKELFIKYNDINKIIKSTNIIKHSGWWCLSRHHVKKLLINKDIKLYQRVKAGDEHILSLIYPDKNIKDIDITYCNWEYTKKEIDKLSNKIKHYYELKDKSGTAIYDKKIFSLRRDKAILGSHPKTYNKLSKNEINEIKTSSAFFYRKFSKDSDIYKIFDKLITTTNR